MPEEPEVRRIAHDLLNLLAAMGNYAGMIAGRASDESRADAEALRRVIDRATDLVRELSGRAPAERGRPTRVPPGRGERVLVVDDEPAIRDLVVSVLTHGGYTVLEAGGADEALALMERAGPVDLLLTDLHLPGTSGEQLASRVAEASPAVRVLYASGDPHPPDVVGAWLQKPFTTDALLAIVRETLDASAGGS